MAYIAVPSQQFFVVREADSKRFCVAKEVMVRYFAKAAMDAGTDHGRSGEVAETAIKVASQLPEVPAADPLWAPPGASLLHQCLN